MEVLTMELFCPPGNIWQYLETFLVTTTWWRKGWMLHLSSEYKSGMPLNILQYIGLSFAIKNYSFQNINSAKAEKFCSRDLFVLALGCLPSKLFPHQF